MIHLIATCLIAAGTTFSIPEGWQAIDLGAQGHRLGHPMLHFEPIKETYIRLKRPIEAGDKVQLPEGCTVAAEAPKKKSELQFMPGTFQGSINEMPGITLLPNNTVNLPFSPIHADHGKPNGTLYQCNEKVTRCWTMDGKPYEGTHTVYDHAGAGVVLYVCRVGECRLIGGNAP